MPTTSPRPIPRVRKFDHGAALELALQGWRYSEIAKRLKCHESSVKQALGKYQHLLTGLQSGELQSYRKNRSELFTMVEREMMASMLDPEAVAKASLNNRAYAFQQIHTARRLEEGKSTENHAVLRQLMGGALKSAGKASVVTPSLSSPSSQPVDSNPADIMDSDAMPHE